MKKSVIPNALTWLRIVVIPVFIVCFFAPEPLNFRLTTGLFVIASISDFLDGYLARKWKVESNFGRAMDPVADKLLVAAALILIVMNSHAPAIAVAAVLIICRELLIAGIREALAGRTVIHVSPLAKWKTATQLVAVCVLLVSPLFSSWDVGIAGGMLLCFSAFLAWVTAWDYLRAAWPLLKN